MKLKLINEAIPPQGVQREIKKDWELRQYPRWWAIINLKTRKVQTGKMDYISKLWDDPYKSWNAVDRM